MIGNCIDLENNRIRNKKPVAVYKCEFIRTCHHMQEVLKFLIFFLFFWYTTLMTLPYGKLFFG
jgi:hypothetical protein